MASTVTVTGWWSANACSQPGMKLVSTKADEAKTSGNSIGKMAAWAASPLGAPRPIVATTHEKAKANSSTRPRAAR